MVSRAMTSRERKMKRDFQREQRSKRRRGGKQSKRLKKRLKAGKSVGGFRPAKPGQAPAPVGSGATLRSRTVSQESARFSGMPITPQAQAAPTGEPAQTITAPPPEGEKFFGVDKAKLTRTLEITALTGLAALGGIAIATLMGGTAITTTAVAAAAKVGTKGLSKAALRAISTAGGFATNSATAAVTASWITRLATSLGKPRLIASVIGASIVGAIGSYPFAGFIREEALQAIKGSYTGAMIAGNTEVAQAAIVERLEILNPNITEQILNKIPFVNVLKQLKDYFDTARTAVALDQKLLDDMKIQQETGETDTERWLRAKEDELAMKSTAHEESIERQKEYLQFKIDAETAGAKDVARIWAKNAEQESKQDLLDQQAIVDMWLAYKVAAYELNQSSRAQNLNFSNLNFGLL